MNKNNVTRIDLNLFAVLDAIYTEGGVTRAAEKLHLTQPAISHALARLRELFGDPLFLRRGHQLVPSPLTRTIIEPVRRSLRVLEFTLHETTHFDPGKTRKNFVLGLRDILESTVLPPLMQRVMETAPGADISSVRVNRRVLEASLASGNMDVAMDIRLPVSDEIHRQRVEAGRLAVVARRGHPAVGGNMDLDTYLQQQHVMVSSRQRGPGLEDIALADLGLQRKVRLRCQHYFAACRVVSGTDLILTMSERYARVLNVAFDNQLLAVPLPDVTLDLYMYWHASAEEDPANRWLRSQLLQSLSG